MLQIKIFTGSNINDVESAVNAWIRSTIGAEVQQIAQSESGTTSSDWTVTITLLYKPQSMVS